MAEETYKDDVQQVDQLVCGCEYAKKIILADSVGVTINEETKLIEYTLNRGEDNDISEETRKAIAFLYHHEYDWSVTIPSADEG